jgi:Tfp pilus assembly protein PilN
MSMTMLLIAWAAITAVLIVLLIYRSTLSMHEDDQLFLDESSSNLRAEQEELQVRMKKITPFVRILGALSGLLIVAVGAMWVVQRMNNSW